MSAEDADAIIEAYDPDEDTLRMSMDLCDLKDLRARIDNAVTGLPDDDENTASGLNELGELRENIGQTLAELEGLYSDRAALIRRLADNGVRISSICEQAGLNRQRIYAIRKAGR